MPTKGEVESDNQTSCNSNEGQCICYMSTNYTMLALNLVVRGQIWLCKSVVLKVETDKPLPEIISGFAICFLVKSILKPEIVPTA